MTIIGARCHDCVQASYHMHRYGTTREQAKCERGGSLKGSLEFFPTGAG